MPRIHAFELQDQPWYPATLGDAGTAYLRTLSRLLGAERFLTPPIASALKEAGVDRIVDLCSGAGGPVTDIARQLREQGQPVEVLLSDLKPNTAALAALADAPGVTVSPQPVDAAAVPAGMTGLRTLFNAFHHFDDDLALAVLQDTVDAGQPIAIVELSERAPQTVIGAALIPLMVCLVMPMVRPVRLHWLVLTYLLPILPLAIAWDGLISHLRTRSPDELRALTARLDAPGWSWTAERVPVQPGAAYTWLLGLPPA